MDDLKGYQVFRNVTDDPASEKGREVINKLLEGGSVKSFPFSISRGPARSPDSHTVDCVIYITGGNLEIGFGEQYADKVEVGKGDFLYIKKDTPHLEHASGDMDVELVVYYTGEFGVKGVA